MSGTIENRDKFLENIAQKLNHKPGEYVQNSEWQNQPQLRVYRDYSQDQLIDVIKQVSESIHTQVVETDSSHLSESLNHLIQTYGGGPVVATRDARFKTLGLASLMQDNKVYVWDTAKGHSNIEAAAKANIGLSICDVMLAESATAGFFNDKDKARSVSLLPVASLVIVPKSTIVPRLTQAMARVQKSVDAGEDPAPYINFISGPSNSADIEMRLVVGVHGPVKVAYLIVSDQ
ncbi:MAG: lactate utilization protein C [Sporolactobacillus sp.]